MSIYTVIVNVILVEITIFPPAFRNKVIIAFFIVGSPLENIFPVESALLGQDRSIFVVSRRNPISTAGGFKQNQHIFFDFRGILVRVAPALYVRDDCRFVFQHIHRVHNLTCAAFYAVVMFAATSICRFDVCDGFFAVDKFTHFSIFLSLFSQAFPAACHELRA
nr:MAG TPA: hypothetical protein [Caudoviricetes sp.]